ncbi:hypothetical protein [Microbulbifer sp. VAAF005]|uniref:hypothetical protein n=1 Tax=Microbulbifer sp. VAAF005 TaxID=3034230 RepID=UPI0024AD3F8B|nr:hypothetical protein [Microbulbifer sp. VAAF005]WHI45589.1 hypothetical protein P0078_17920 [Microbulbifer sp. VAAF005]
MMLKKLLMWPPIYKRLPAAWQASKLNLYGPDFEQAPWKDIDLSGIKLNFKNPPQTRMFPNDIRVEGMNIYDDQSFSPPGMAVGLRRYIRVAGSIPMACSVTE